MATNLSGSMVTPGPLSPSQITQAVGDVTSQLWPLGVEDTVQGERWLVSIGTRPTLDGACDLGRGSRHVEGVCVQPALGLNLLPTCLFSFAGMASSC